MYLCIIIINLLVISYGVEDEYYIGFSEATGRLYTRDAVIVTATKDTETNDYDPNARKSNKRFGLPCVTWEGVTGVCSRYQECFPDEFEHDIDMGATCYEEETKRYGVCCTKETKQYLTVRRNLNYDSKGFLQNAGNENNNQSVMGNILQESPADTQRKAFECGVKNSKYGRIVGGKPSKSGKWPWLIVIIKKQFQYCGASLITNSHALTAAHCTRMLTARDLSELRADLGEYDLSKMSSSSSIFMQIKRAVSHREFTKEKMLSDIAIITFRRKISFSKYIRPICLPSPQKSYAGVLATAAGWGRLWDDGPLPSVLQEVNLRIWTNRDCRIRFGSVAPGGIVDGMMCAGVLGKDTCSGDSGGPLMVKDGATWIAAGIVSWGLGCGNTEYPGAYTRVSSYLSWIKANLN